MTSLIDDYAAIHRQMRDYAAPKVEPAGIRPVVPQHGDHVVDTVTGKTWFWSDYTNSWIHDDPETGARSLSSHDPRTQQAADAPALEDEQYGMYVAGSGDYSALAASVKAGELVPFEFSPETLAQIERVRSAYQRMATYRNAVQSMVAEAQELKLP